MRRVIEFIKWPMTFPVLGLAGLYLFWFFTAPISLFFGDFAGGLIIFGIYVIATFLARIAWNNWKLSLGLLILIAFPAWLGALFTCIFLFDYATYAPFPYYELVAYVAGMILLAAYPVTVVLRNLANNFKIMQLLLAIAMTILLSGNILYLVFFYPVAEETTTFENYRYAVVSSRDSDGHVLETFYKCKEFSLECDSLYSAYSWPLNTIIVDQQKREVSLLSYEGLIYTDGEDARLYVRGTVAVLGKSIYQLSENCNNLNEDKGYWSCQTYTYRLYKCNLDYKSCERLPMEYTTSLDLYTYTLESNEETNEINLYDDDEYNPNRILIYTYGANPRCYVEGCTITGQTK